LGKSLGFDQSFAMFIGTMMLLVRLGDDLLGNFPGGCG
jgi:hypothetical protein